jgi:hypothetical protein
LYLENTLHKKINMNPELDAYPEISEKPDSEQIVLTTD